MTRHQSSPDSAVVVAFIGNPNTGKSTLFNALSGNHQQIGNYPGVTVEKKSADITVDGRRYRLMDLPGTYSLSPRSPDEMITMEVLLGGSSGTEAADSVVCVVDASNLQRNLYLVTQILQLRVPAVIALNMNDVASAEGTYVDAVELENRLGVPVVPIHAKQKTGLEALVQAICQARISQQVTPSFLPSEIHVACEKIGGSAGAKKPNPFLIERWLVDPSDFLTDYLRKELGKDLFQQVCALRESESEVGKQEAQARYAWIERQLASVIRREGRPRSWTDRLDGVLLHPWSGSLVALFLLMILFQCVFWIAEPASQVIDGVTAWLSDGASRWIPEGPLQSLVTHGLIEGVGGVLVFLPQIFLIFFAIAILEDSGYLARIACLMDRVMAPLGLSGRSFLPLLSSFACAIPGIMATRVIDNRKDRLITILVAPLMTCSARIPVYTLLIATFIPHPYLQGITMLALYLLGILAAIVVALILKKTILRGEQATFLLELPTYKWPDSRVVFRKMWDGGWSFIQGAGTLIVSITVLVWAASYFPRGAQISPILLETRASLQQALENSPNDPLPNNAQEELARIEAEIQQQQATQLRQSYLGRAGIWLEPAVKPLGWDWRLGCAAIASFPAREVVVATLGVLYKLGDSQDEHSTSLRDTLRTATWDGTDRPVYTIPVALSVMVFFALCAQCASTLAAIRRETNSWRWPVFTFIYMTLLAYVGAWLTYNVGTWFTL